VIDLNNDILLFGANKNKNMLAIISKLKAKEVSVGYHHTVIIGIS
jgi:hypothetical protein